MTYTTYPSEETCIISRLFQAFNLQIKALRAVIVGGGLDYSDFAEEVREMQAALLTSVKDLRSQLCREACVTIAYASLLHFMFK